MPDNIAVGKVYGCYTVVKGTNGTKADIDSTISDINKSLADNSTTVNNLRKLINAKAYTCKTNCGRTLWLTENDIKNSDITPSDSMGCETCKLRETRQADVIKNHESCNTDYSGLQFNTLKVIGKLDKRYEELSIEHNIHGDRLVSTKYDLYRCRCDLCGTEYVFRSDRFKIGMPDSPRYIGDINSIKARCDCHQHSVGQWVICKLLIEHKVNYLAEYSPDDLVGIGDNVRLHYDFAVFNEDGSVKCFIEYNGSQHERAAEQFGGERGLAIQKCLDELKRIYAREHNIRLIEIPSRVMGYNAISDVLHNSEII